MKVLWPLAALVVLAFIVAMVVKSRSDNHTQPPVAAANSNLTAASREVPTHSPRTSHTSRPDTEPETDRLAALLFDKNASLKIRRQSARSLAKIGTEQAMAALKSALTNDVPPYVKASIAESFGEAANPEAAALLHELVHGKDEITARGAARGLATRGDTDAVNTLGNLLFNDQTPLSVRTESALALGDVDLPAAQDLLTRAVAQIHDEDVVESVLDGLGRRPFAQTKDFFKNYLNSPDVPTAAKVLAIEAVRDAEGDDVRPFLSNYLTDANPEVRAAAKDAVDFLGPATAVPN